MHTGSLKQATRCEIKFSSLAIQSCTLQLGTLKDDNSACMHIIIELWQLQLQLATYNIIKYSHIVQLLMHNVYLYIQLYSYIASYTYIILCNRPEPIMLGIIGYKFGNNRMFTSIIKELLRTKQLNVMKCIKTLTDDEYKAAIELLIRNRKHFW